MKKRPKPKPRPKPPYLWILIATGLLAVVPSCVAGEWLFGGGTATRKTNAEGISEVAQAVLPPPFGALVTSLLGVGALVFGANKKQNADNSLPK